MNFLRTGWSLLSSSFTQSEGDPNDSAQAEEVAEGAEEYPFEPSGETSPTQASLKARRNSLDSNDDMTEFTDAVDRPDVDVVPEKSEGSNPQGSNLESEIAGRESFTSHLPANEGQLESKSDVSMNSFETKAEDSDIKPINPMDKEGKLSEYMAKNRDRYSTLQASDSDDSDEVIPPPAAPVGRPVNTDTQIKEIIKNLGGDLDILTLEDENITEATLPGEKTFGETLYVTAYDQTILPSPPHDTSEETFSVTKIQADFDSSPDSAIASSSKSSIESGGSVKLNFDYRSDSDGPNTGPATTRHISDEIPSPAADENLNLILKDKAPLDVSVEELDQTSELNLTVQEVKPKENTEELPQGEDRENSSDSPSQVKSALITVAKPVNAREDKAEDSSEVETPEIPQENPPDKEKPEVEGRKMDESAEDAVPISRGAYTIDFDNLDEFNPFQCNKGICNSPEKPAKPFAASVENNTDVNSCQVDDTAIVELNHTEQNPPKSVENNAAITDQPTSKMNDQMHLTNGIDDELTKKQSEFNDDKTLSTKNDTLRQEKPPEMEEQKQDGEDVPLPKSSYSLDLDNLDNIDPFKTNKGLQNSPTKEVPPAPSGYSLNLDNLEDVDPFKSKQTLSFSPPKSPVKNNVGLLKHMDNLNEEVKSCDVISQKEPAETALRENTSSSTEVKLDENIENISDNLENVAPASEIPTKKVVKPELGANRKKMTRPVKKKPSADPAKPQETSAPDNEIIVPRGSYTLDFDKLESFDPFKSIKGLSNSPTKAAPSNNFDDVPISGAAFKPQEQTRADDSSPVDPPDYPILEKHATSDMPQDSSPAKELSKMDETQEEESKKETPPVEMPEQKTLEPPIKKQELDPVKDEEEPIPLSKGSYNLDFDNLDSIDPFKTSKGLPNSPTKSAPDAGFPATFDISTEKNEPVAKTGLQEDEPKQNLILEGNIKAEAPQSVEMKPETEEPEKKSVSEISQHQTEKPETCPADNEEDLPILPKGSYNLDFDKLDSLDPFKTSKGLANSPTKAAPAAFSAAFDDAVRNQEPATAEVIESKTSGDSEKTDAQTTEKNKASLIKKPIKKSGLARKKLIKPSIKPVETNAAPDDDEILVPKGAYNLDFDNLDGIDPFKTSKGLPNSPTKAAPASGFSATFDEAIKTDASNKEVPEVITQSEESAAGPTDSQVEEKANKEPDAVTKFKKKSSLARKKLTKPSAAKPVEQEENNEEVPLPKGAYNLDLDNLDSIDPFKSSKGLPNSPTKDGPAPTSYPDFLDTEDPFKSSNKMGSSPPSSPSKSSPDSFKDAQSELQVTPEPTEGTQGEDTCGSEGAVDPFKPTKTIRKSLTRDVTSTSETDPGSQSAIDRPSDSASESMQKTSEPPMVYKSEEQKEFERLNETEEFYPASSVFQDSASLDFLDKLGDKQSFTESALRKQSLYVKFDPLVSGSPLKQASEQIKGQTTTSEPSISSNAVQQSGNLESLGKGDFSFKDSNVTKQQNLSNYNLGFGEPQPNMDSFNQPYLSQQSYQTMSPALKYTQGELDNTLKKAEQEWEKEREQIKSREETLNEELKQMNQVVKDYEKLVSELSSNWDENGTLTRGQQLMRAEHEQALEDMAALERSYDDLCRRYNRLKNVVAQFKKNEEILKKSTNEMMEEAKATEQKYLTLKVKAEKEIAQANNELQQVKSNAQQEVARAQAQVKMLELKCESLQSQIKDCDKQNEELTKLCDELISKQS